MPRIMKRCLLIALLSATALAAQAFGQTTFVFEDAPSFTLPPQGATAESPSFWVFSKGGEVADAEVRVKDIKDPDGQSRGPNAATATLESPTVTPDGVRVTLKLTPSLFNKPGKYRVILLFRSRSADATKVTPATLTPVIDYPAADINVDEVKNQTIEVTRSWPLGTASGTFPFPLAETTGRARLGELSWSDQGIFVKDTKVRRPGSVSVAPAASPSPQPGDAPAFNVTLAGLEHAGSFETNLVVNSPGFAARKVIPLRINVADSLLFPAAAIFAGVLAGFAVTYLSTRWRPQQINRVQLLRLREELARWRERVKAAPKAERIENLWARLRNAEEANELGDGAQVRTELAAVEQELAAFRKEEATARAAAREALTAARAAADAYEEQFGGQFEGDDALALQDIRDRLADVERLINQGQVDYAQEKQAAAGALFAGFKKRRLTRHFDRLKAEFERLRPLTTPADQKPAADLIAEAEKLLGQSKLEEATAKLDALRKALEELDAKKQTKALGARGDAEEEYQFHLEELAAERPVRPRTRIRIRPAPAARTAGANIQFAIEDGRGLLRPGDRVRWTFGEPGSQQEDGPAATYRYREDGEYRVTAEVLRDAGDGGPLSFEEPLTILPGAGRAEILGVLGRIRKVDLALSAVALLLALATGLNTLYIGKPFGTLSDYLVALLWGFGLDQGVRGVADVFKKVAPSAGGSA